LSTTWFPAATAETKGHSQLKDNSMEQ
jgi:hypothetical protein